ncbi:hypothetical protein P8452_28112 [Trifolium repens]|nr:hypothetical protein P8452_28112 [Trifolium repens]
MPSSFFIRFSNSNFILSLFTTNLPQFINHFNINWFITIHHKPSLFFEIVLFNANLVHKKKGAHRKPRIGVWQNFFGWSLFGLLTDRLELRS